MLTLEIVVLILCASFTGASFYVVVAEQPARLLLDHTSLLIQWKASYSRGFAMQASLAMLACILGIVIWYYNKDCTWYLAGAILIGSNWPYTLIAIMPTNKILQATDNTNANTDTRKLIIKWCHLHLVRTVLGAAATACIAVGMLQHISYLAIG